MLSLGLLVLPAFCQATMLVDDFPGDAPRGWQIAGTPEYYRGGFGAEGLEIVQDPDHGACLSAPLAFRDPERSEVVFLTKTLDRPVVAADVRTVRFWYRLDGAQAVPVSSIRVRLRTSPQQFVDLDFHPARELVLGQWARVELPLDLSQARNLWGWVLDTVKWLTFRLDDLDEQNVDLRLLLTGIELDTATPPVPHTATVRRRPAHDGTRVLYARHASAGFYGLEETMAEALPDAAVDLRLFRGLHFPLWWERRAPEDLLAYDLAVFVDVDPFVLSWEDACALADAVASGTHLLWLGGPNTLNASRRPESPLFSVLPVTFEAGAAENKGAAAPAVAPGAEAHPLASCVPLAALNPVRHANPVEPRDGAQVVLTAGDAPLVVTWPYQRGRATVVAAWCDGATLPDFFTGPGSKAWKRRLVLWAAGRLPGAWLNLRGLSTLTPRGGEELVLDLATGGEPGALRPSVRAEAWDLPKGETPTPAAVEVTERADGAFSLCVPTSPRPQEVRIASELRRGEEVVDTVEVVLAAAPTVAGEIRWLRHKNCFAPTQLAQCSLAFSPPKDGDAPAGLDGATLDLWLSEPRRPLTPLVPLGDRAFAPDLPLEFVVPVLTPGEYWLCAEARDAAGQALAAVEEPFFVVDRLDPADFFPMITFLDEGAGGHVMDEAQIRDWVRDAWDHGFNTAAIPGLASFRAERLGTQTSLRQYLETQAQRLGMATIYEYGSFKLMGRAEATKPCVLSPEYPAALRELLDPLIDICRRVPRLISTKVTDEPVASLANLDGCDYCRAEFKKRYGVDLPALDPLPDDPYLRWALADFVGYYVQEGFRLGHELVLQAGTGGPTRPGGVSDTRPFDLLLTYMSPGLGFGRPLSGQEDALDWSVGCDRSDFDVYPYFYPSSQRIRMLLAWPCFAFQRAVARHHRQPWGFYVELDERNWPFQQNPAQASSECAWTAIAQGANYLNSFIHRRFATGSDPRPERWDHLGRNLRLMRGLSPLLAGTERPPSPIALYYPSAQQAIENGYDVPQYLSAAVQQGFGECDLLLEEPVAREGLMGESSGLLMIGVRILDSRAAGPLADWVKAGGLLATDRWPETDERGRAVDLRGLLGAPAEPADWSLTACGKGKVLWLPDDFDGAYREAVEGDDAARAAALRTGLCGALVGAGLRPGVTVEDDAAQMEAGLRVGDGVAVVTVVNHAAHRNSGRVTVRRLGFAPQVAWQPTDEDERRVSGPLAGCATGAADAALDVTLDARESAVFVLWPQRASAVRLHTPEEVAPGDRLRLRIRADDERSLGLAEVEVRGPDGALVSAISGPRSLPAGERELTWTVPQNAPRGTYRVQVRLPAFELAQAADFRVR